MVRCKTQSIKIPGNSTRRSECSLGCRSLPSNKLSTTLGQTGLVYLRKGPKMQVPPAKNRGVQAKKGKTQVEVPVKHGASPREPHSRHAKEMKERLEHHQSPAWVMNWKTKKDRHFGRSFSLLSGRLDSNQRPRAPQTRALTNCATSRKRTAKLAKFRKNAKLF